MSEPMISVEANMLADEYKALVSGDAAALRVIDALKVEVASLRLRCEAAEKFIAKAFIVYPNLDLDIDTRSDKGER